jgi:hypothetical protein
MKKFLIFTFLAFNLSSCEKFGYKHESGYGVEFYYITDFRTAEGSSKILKSSVHLDNSVLIRYDDIVSYNPDTYTFKISDAIVEQFVKTKNNPAHGKAFAVTLNGEIIYTGYFWWGFSSSSVDWVVIDPIFFVMGNNLTVQLGYPGLFEGDYIPDNRNDTRLIDFMERDGKIDN